MFWHTVYLKYHFKIASHGSHNILLMNVYDAAMVACGGAFFFIALTLNEFAFWSAFSFLVVVVFVLSRVLRKALSVHAGEVRPKLRMGIYDTAMIAWGAISGYAGMLAVTVFR